MLYRRRRLQQNQAIYATGGYPAGGQYPANGQYPPNGQYQANQYYQGQGAGYNPNYPPQQYPSQVRRLSAVVGT
ncbi:hypothetical protein DL93DRAFT_2077033 [Clavulina sp. PMI_390]|nr:hypothetical protein DL93DRAFT_2077033 [Clavulina sp. PMI_390]